MRDYKDKVLQIYGLRVDSATKKYGSLLSDAHRAVDPIGARLTVT